MAASAASFETRTRPATEITMYRANDGKLISQAVSVPLNPGAIPCSEKVTRLLTLLFPTRVLLAFPKAPLVRSTVSPTARVPLESKSAKMIQPDAQPVPVAQVLLLLLRHSVTAAPRLMASVRAKDAAATNSLLTVATRLLANIWLSAGMAIAVKMPTTATVTISSITVKPD